ncbi:MAG TPA: UvrD-helicase domain-containing protein, partial [Flexilinea sp.]|nr:UvrD-helicase domain-containing protein [Flexilinea sp.]
AGPGSGKTRVLTQRIAYLIKEMGVPAYNILAVTFTNKAAREMQDRVEDLLGESIQGNMWLGTFHAVCARILRREASFLPFGHNYVIMDADDQVTLIKQIIKELNLDDKIFRPNSVHNEISNAKNNLLFPQDMLRSNYREETVFRVYERYQQALEKSNAVDFDDLLLWCWKLLKDNPDIRDRYSRRFRHILVDEFQDTNTAQYQLLKLLVGQKGNIFVVGDEDQSIYRWRGADYHNIQLFEKDYPNCTKILLEQNYRSTQNVLNVARSVIDHNPNRTRKNLFSDRGSGDKIVYYEAEDDRMEARYVVETISKLIENGNARGGDFAVLYRTNAQSRLLEDAFLYRGMSYRLVGAQRFYGRREVKDMIAYLRLAYNPQDEISLARVINIPPRGIGEKSFQNLRMAALESGKASGDVLLDLGKYGPESVFWPDMGRGALPLADFGARLLEWSSDPLISGGITMLLDKIIADTRYQDYLKADGDDESDRWENVEELRKMAFEYEDRGLADFLQNLALVSDQDTMTNNTDVPTLMTLHAVKGLEFNRVFIIGLDDGLLPHNRSFDDPEEMAEERRLFYVGLTRARNHVTLVRAQQRMAFGVPDITIPSRFLTYIPEELIIRENESSKESRRSSGSYTSGSRWESTPSWASTFRSGPPSASQSMSKNSNREVRQIFSPQDNVNHPLWGEGIILESKIEDGEEVVQVQFKSSGIKKLIVSLSKLKKIV